MAAFPTLTRGVDIENFTDSISPDPTIRNEMDNGLVKTRPRFTAIKRAFHIEFRFLASADVTALKTFEETTVVVGSVPFTWENPFDSVTYTVVLKSPIQYQVEPTDHATLSAKMDFIES